jgi:hypothetical protein
MFATPRQHRHPRRVDGHARIAQPRPGRVEILEPGLLRLRPGQFGDGRLDLLGMAPGGLPERIETASSAARSVSARVCSRLAAARLVSA